MRFFFSIALIMLITKSVAQQQDSSFFRRLPSDTSRQKMNMDAVYNRPFLAAGKTAIALGGYVEANSSYFVTEGVSEGISFQLPRLTLFVSSAVSKKVRFLTEIELEDGGKEISIEFASADIEFHPLLNFRGGIVMNPIGAFNQNHDGPKWEFISRPLSATTIIPATWSNVGFGIFGKYGRRQLVWAYEAYLTNGFDDRIIANSTGRTFLPASKQNPERFEESFNGIPLVTMKSALKHRKAGEIGISWMGGIYNRFETDGIELDRRRRVDLFAIDFNTTLPSRTYITGEWVWAFVDVPRTYSQQFGNRQHGWFVDVVQTLVKKPVMGWDNATLNLALRAEYADYNVGRFHETKGNIYDHIFAIVPGLSFRPSAQTVIRLNYRYHWETDLLGNPAIRTGGVQFGLSTYF